MNNPAPFRLSLRQARALRVGVVVCVVLAALAFLAGLHALTHDDMRSMAGAPLVGSILLAIIGLGLYLRLALGLSHQRQLWTMAALTDPHTEDPDTPAPDGQPDGEPDIPAPRPGVEPTAEPTGPTKPGAAAE